MSEPLLGEAASFEPEPAPSGAGNGALRSGSQPHETDQHDGEGDRPDWAGTSDDVEELLDGAGGAGPKTRRRRRGSRGGKGHRHGPVSVVDGSGTGDDARDEGLDLPETGDEPGVPRAVQRGRATEVEVVEDAAPGSQGTTSGPRALLGAGAGLLGGGAGLQGGQDLGAEVVETPITPVTPIPAVGPIAPARGSREASPEGSAGVPLPAKPKIGDTRPGSPPAPKRRPRKDALGARELEASANGAAQGAPAGGGPAGGEEDEAALARPRRARRRKAGEDAGPVGANGEAGTGVASGRGATAGSGRGAGSRRATAPGGANADAADVPGAATSGSGRAAAAASAAAALAAAGDQAGTGGRGAKAAAADRPREASSRRTSGDRRNRPLGRYLMVVHVGPTATQIAVLEGRTLIEHYVSRPADDATQIDGNIYLGRVQNVLPGMEAAFVDIGTPKNAVLYRGDLRYDEDEVGPAADDDSKPTRGRLGGSARDARIEQLLRTGQNIICQVTKNPIGTKGARLTQEVSLPGRFVVLIPDSDTYGISKRLGDDERRRLRKILDDIRPSGHGLIVRTAAEGASADELGRDVARLLRQWETVQSLARASRAPQLLYREPDLAVRVIREEFNRDYRGVVIDDPVLYEQVREYVASITPELADRVELVSPNEEPLPLFERFRVHEQVHKALDRKVWLPSGGSLIIERTEALTVIDVNTGKNVGTSNLEETVFRNNLEAAEEIARQLRLRDIGGIIVIDFIDMEVMANRAEVIRTFREALARDKTRSQVFDISELGLVEMTRKRISEGLVESYSETCPTCGGRGIIFDESLL
ncbi:MAG TPA: Rne/Rng family ribonuclease [Acidimicrobiales bacterium]|nr:Rne/Rng family ribonuclease [Acidimicrobiales bacterium]